VLLTAPAGHAQPLGPTVDDGAAGGGASRAKVRTLGHRDPLGSGLGFGLLLDRHLKYRAGGLARLPAAPSAAAPRPGVYFTVTPDEALVFDRVVTRLAGGAFAPAALAGCAAAGGPRGVPARAVPCVPTLRAGTISITFGFQQGNLTTNGVAFGSGSSYSGVVDGSITDNSASSALTTGGTSTIGNQFRSGSPNGQTWCGRFSYDLTELNDFITANTSANSSVTINSVTPPTRTSCVACIG